MSFDLRIIDAIAVMAIVFSFYMLVRKRRPATTVVTFTQAQLREARERGLNSWNRQIWKEIEEGRDASASMATRDKYDRHTAWVLDDRYFKKDGTVDETKKPPPC